LDPSGIRWLRDFLRRLAGEGRAVLVSSHVLQEMEQAADDIIVINRGKSVAQGSLREIMARSASDGGVKGARPDVRKPRDIRHAQGANVSGDAREIRVYGRTGEDIGRLIVEHGIVISELTSVGPSLEDIFFELTGGAGGGPS